MTIRRMLRAWMTGLAAVMALTSCYNDGDYTVTPQRIDNEFAISVGDTTLMAGGFTRTYVEVDLTGALDKDAYNERHAREDCVAFTTTGGLLAGTGEPGAKAFARVDTNGRARVHLTSGAQPGVAIVQASMPRVKGLVNQTEVRFVAPDTASVEALLTITPPMLPVLNAPGTMELMLDTSLVLADRSITLSATSGLLIPEGGSPASEVVVTPGFDGRVLVEFVPILQETIVRAEVNGAPVLKRDVTVTAGVGSGEGLLALDLEPKVADGDSALIGTVRIDVSSSVEHLAPNQTVLLKASSGKLGLSADDAEDGADSLRVTLDARGGAVAYLRQDKAEEVLLTATIGTLTGYDFRRTIPFKSPPTRGMGPVTALRWQIDTPQVANDGLSQVALVLVAVSDSARIDTLSVRVTARRQGSGEAVGLVRAVGTAPPDTTGVLNLEVTEKSTSLSFHPRQGTLAGYITLTATDTGPASMVSPTSALLEIVEPPSRAEADTSAADGG